MTRNLTLALINHCAPLVQAIIDGEREQRTWTKSSLHIAPDSTSDTSAWSDDEEEGISTSESGPEGDAPDNANLDDDELITESKDLHLLVNESITTLLRLSVQVHSSTRKAKFAKSSINKNYAIGPDVSHVRDYFPHLEITGNLALAERLGKANAQRRKWLWYRRRHREKLSVDLSGATDDPRPPPGKWMERHEAHEMEAHRKRWTCGLCNSNLPSLVAMKEHIHTAHRDLVHTDLVDDVAQRFGKPVTSFHASDCPLCDYPHLLRQRGLSEQEVAHIPVDAFGRHIGRHLEQLALFVLPRTDLISYDDMSDEERETETHSDSDDGRSESGQPEALSEPELMQKLSEVISLRQTTLKCLGARQTSPCGGSRRRISLHPSKTLMPMTRTSFLPDTNLFLEATFTLPVGFVVQGAERKDSVRAAQSSIG